MFKKIILLALVLVIAAVVPLVTACGGGGGGGTPNPNSDVVSVALDKVLPQKAGMLAGLSVEKILGDKDIANLYNTLVKDNLNGDPSVPQTFDALLAKFQAETGLNLKDFQLVEAFGDISALTQLTSNDGPDLNTDYLGAIVTGTFTNENIVAAIQKGTGTTLTSTPYGGYPVYVIEPGEANASMTFLGKGVMVIGSSAAVKDVIDNKNSGKSNANWDLLQTYGRLGDVMFKVAVKIPDDWTAKIPVQQDVSGLGSIDLKPFKSAKLGGLAANKVGGTSSLEVRVGFPDSSTATTAKQSVDNFLTMIKGLLQFAGGSVPQAADIGKVLNATVISTRSEVLSLRIELTTAQIEDVAPLLKGFVGSGQ